MLTYLSLPSVCTTNGTDSRIAVAGSSVPNVPWSRATLKSVIAAWSAKLWSWSVSTHTLLVVVFHSTPNRPLLPAGLPSRLRSLPSSPPRRGSRSSSVANR